MHRLQKSRQGSSRQTNQKELYRSLWLNLRMAIHKAVSRYTPAYPIIVRLGTELVEKGERCSAPASGDCISNAALRQSVSLGIRRLAVIPTSMARCVWVTAPNCSIQPPRKARACSPHASTPLVIVEKYVPKAKVKQRSSRLSIHMKKKPCTRLCATRPPINQVMAFTPATMRAR